MTIRSKLKIAALVPFILAVIIGAALLWSHRATSESRDKDRAIVEIIGSADELHGLALSFMLHREERPRRQFLAEQGTVAALIAGISPDDPRQRQFAENIRENNEALKESFLRLASLPLAGGDQGSTSMEEAGERLAGQVLIRARAVQSGAQGLENLIKEEIANRQAWVNLLILSFILAMALPLAALLWSMTRTIGGSFRRLTEGTEIVASGNLDHRVGITEPDEVGDLARAFDLMTLRLKETTVSRDALVREVREREQAEEALRDALVEAEDGRRMLKALMEHVPEGITIAEGSRAEIRMVSRYGEEAFGPHEGQETAEVAGRWKVFHRDGTTPLPLEELPLMRAITRGEVVRNQELVQVNERGERLDLLCNAGPVRDAGGNVVGGVVAWRDVSDMRRAREELGESERRFRSLFESMSEGFALHEIILDPVGKPVDFRFLQVNPAFEEQTGLRAADIQGRAVREVIPGIEEFWIERYGRVALTGERDHFEMWSEALGRWYEVSAFRTEPGRFGVVFMDVTERKRAEEELERSSHQRRIALDAARLGWWSYDPVTGMSGYDDRFQDIFGVLGPKRPDEEILAFMHPDDFPGVWKEVEAALNPDNPKPYFAEYRVNRPDGRTVWVEAHGLATFEGEGHARRAVGFVGTVADITDRKTADEELRQLNESLERRVAERAAQAEQRTAQLKRLALQLFEAEDTERQRIADILHDDLQQHLSAIRLQLGMLGSRDGLSAELAESLRSLERLVKEGMDKTRNLSQEIIPPTLRKNGLSAAIRWVAGEMREKHGLAVQVEADPAADPESDELASFLYRSARELLFNVAKHSGVDTAFARFGLENGRLVLGIEDQGKGFDPSAMGDGRDESPGFGLFSIEERIGFLGGRMDFASSPGKGCRVTLTVPVSAGLSAGKTEGETAGPGRTGGGETSGKEESRAGDGLIRVLLVDDHKVLREGLASLLKTLPGLLVVGEAANGAEALHFVEALEPDVVLMDINMPVMDGFQATAACREARPEVRVIGLSMHDDAASRERMINAGACAFVSKSAPAGELIEHIRGAAGQRA